jgi:4-amino-4-deoxy-L-arabinose transferase-like glycosyltransferase
MPRRRAQLLVLALFVCVRLVHLAQLVDSPALVQQHWPDSDMFAFDHWAHNIAHGDVWSQQTQRPLTGWHHDVAAQFRHVTQSTRSDVGLWHDWQGGARFYQEPLFPYLLAGLYALTDAPLMALAFQALLGLLGLWLLMDATRRLLGEREAVIAGLLATLCGPLAYYESLLLRETLAVTTMWLLVRQWAVARERPDWRAYAGLGLAAGLALLTRVAIAPFAVFLLVCSLWSKTQRWQRLGGWLIGLSLPIALLVARNLVVGAPPLAIAGGGVFAFMAANAPGADPWQGLVLDAPVIAKLLQQSYGQSIVLATLQQQPHLMSLEFAKLSALLHNFEMPNNASFLFYRAHAPILKFLPVDLALLLPLGLVGATQLLRTRRARALVLLVLLQVAVLLILQPLSRYRLGLLAALLPLAALGLVFLHGLWQTRRAALLAWLVPIVLFNVWLVRPLPDGVPPTRAVDHAVAWQFWALPTMQKAAERQDHAGVADAMLLFLRGEPADLATWPKPLRSQQTRMAEMYSNAHAIAAQALQMRGQQAEAAQHRAASATLHALNRHSPL